MPIVPIARDRSVPVVPATEPVPVPVPPHLRAFHLPPEATADADALVILAIGNCQAESLRLFLPETTATASGRPIVSVRIPPVHELTAADIAPLHAWLARADHVVLQPIRDGYRGLPIGTRELLAATRPGTRSAIVPVIRFAGLYPRHLIIRPPSDTSLVPPLVAYHDAAILAEAAGLTLPPLTPHAIRAVAEASLGELREREQRHGGVVASDLFTSPRFVLMRTINHPGNPIWHELARRVLDALGVEAEVRDPGREILGSVHAPREAAVIEAFGLDEAPRDEWIVDGRPLSAAAVREAHLRWYAEHPDAVQAGLARHAATLRTLGLGAGRGASSLGASGRAASRRGASGRAASSLDASGLPDGPDLSLGASSLPDGPDLSLGASSLPDGNGAA